MNPSKVIDKRITPVKYSKGRIEILCDNNQWYTIREIARYLGICKSSMTKWLRTKGKGYPYFNLIKKSYRRGESMQESPYKTVIVGDLAHLSDKYNRHGQRVHK